MNLHKLPQLTVLEGLHLARRRECYDEFICSYALAELIVLRVVSVTRKEIQSPRDRGSVRRILFLQRDLNFQAFVPQPHHELFLKFLSNSEEYALHLIAREILSLGNHYRTDIIEPLLAAKGIGRGGLFNSNAKRRKMRGIVRKMLKKADAQLPDWGLKHTENTRKLIADLGPLALIARQLTFEELPHVQKSLAGISSLPAFLEQYSAGALYRWGNLQYMPDFSAGEYLDPLMNNFENYKFKRFASGTGTQTGTLTGGAWTFPNDGGYT